MAVVNQINIGVPGIAVDLLRALVAKEFWKWFVTHSNDRIKVKVWIFRPSVKVRELEPLFLMLFGPNPLKLLSPTIPSELTT